MTTEKDTRGRILEAALDTFASQGYHQTKVADIVDSSQTSKGAVYFHFPSKQDIFLGLVDQFAGLLEGRVKEAIAGGDSGVQRVDAALTVVMETFTRHRRLAKIFLIQASGLGREFEEKRLEIHRSFIGLVTEQLEQALVEGSLDQIDPEITAYAWMGAVNELVISWVHDGYPDPERALPALRGLLLRGIGLEESDLDQD